MLQVVAKITISSNVVAKLGEPRVSVMGCYLMKGQVRPGFGKVPAEFVF